MSEIERKFKKRMTDNGAVWIPDSGIVAPPGSKLLFNVAGAAPLLEAMRTGTSLDYAELASNQSSLRMSSWDSVGLSDKYHLYFKMLGHFSFYRLEVQEAKEWTIKSALDFLLKDMGLSKDRLIISHHPNDQLTIKIWQSLGFGNQLEPIADKHDANFLKDRSGYRTKIGLRGPNGEVIKFWDLVFIEFADETYGMPLDKILVDSGMAVDRLYFAISNVDSSYESPYWKDYIADISKQMLLASNTTVRRFADVGQALAIALLSGIKPSANKQGYVLRKLLRDFYVQLKVNNLDDKLEILLDICMSRALSVYPSDLHKTTSDDAKIEAKSEIIKYQKTIETGLKKAEELKRKNGGTLSDNDKKALSDTFGLPPQLIK